MEYKEWKYSKEFLGKQYTFLFPFTIDFNQEETLKKVVDEILGIIEKDFKTVKITENNKEA